MAKEHLYKFKFNGEEHDLRQLIKDGVLKDNDIYITNEDGFDLAIIRKQGVERLMQHFNLYLATEPKVMAIPYTGYKWGPTSKTMEKSGHNILVVLCGITDGDGKRVTYDIGESSPSNLSKGIAAAYPACMAIKRAIGRTARVHLGMFDWFTEDEAAEFRDLMNVQELKKDNHSRKGSSSSKSHNVTQNDGIDPVPEMDVEAIQQECAQIARSSGMTKSGYQSFITEVAKSLNLVPKDKDPMFATVAKKLDRDAWVVILKELKALSDKE